MPDTADDIFSPRESQSLPQYGFGPTFTFDDLVQNNPFLYRVYTPRPQSPFFDSTEPFFIAQKFNEKFTLSSQILPESVSGTGKLVPSTYSDVAQHMDWTTRHSSPYISTSFSFTWAIWEAARRYRLNVKHDIEIAIIDARAVESRSVTALELLRKSTPKERHKDYWKWYQFALESQDVLVHGSIPGTAVFASVPLLSILDKLPSYFFTSVVSDKCSSPFDRLGWNYSGRKPSYRQFCQDMSECILRLPPQLRLRDTTGGSVRLAVEFLRPWFHRAALDDLTLATSTVCDLAFVIAQWPGQWWAHDHTEMWGLIRSMVQTVGEEVREKQKAEELSEVRRLQAIVGDLERLVRDRESRAALRYKERKALSLPPSPATLVEVSLPPEESKGAVIHSAEPTEDMIGSTRRTTEFSDGPAEPTLRTIERSLELAEGTIEPTGSPARPTEVLSVETTEPISDDVDSDAAESSVGTTEATSEATELSVGTTELTNEITEPSVGTPEPSIGKVEPVKGAMDVASVAATPTETHIRPHSMAETASCIVTGFLFGAFITLCIISSQRRTLITHLT